VTETRIARITPLRTRSTQVVRFKSFRPSLAHGGNLRFSNEVEKREQKEPVSDPNRKSPIRGARER